MPTNEAANSARRCPTRYAERDIGSDRKRSTIPSPRSVAIDDAGAHHPEGEGLHEDAADQVLVVVAAGDGDHAAEDEREQQHEHQRLQRDVEQLLGDLADVLEVAAGQREAVATASQRGAGVASVGDHGGHLVVAVR